MSAIIEFVKFPKISRLSRDVVVTEKIDGTNASILITEDGAFLTGSRTRWITPQDDNHGFSKWAHENKDELMKLGPGHHFGEWWGAGIQRKYGLQEKRFSLFNVHKWKDEAVRPACAGVVPVLYEGPFTTTMIDLTLEGLKAYGSVAAPNFMKPEGLIVFHTQGNFMLKKTIENDDAGKGHGG